MMIMIMVIVTISSVSNSSVRTGWCHPAGGYSQALDP